MGAYLSQLKMAQMPTNRIVTVMFEIQILQMYIYLTVIYLFEYVYLFVFKLVSICDAVGLFFVDISSGDSVVIESFNIGLSWC
jgi:hypothetical protein